MINLQNEHYSVVLGHGGWQDHVQRAMRQLQCPCCDGPSCLSDDEVLADFAVLDPQAARGDAWLLKQIEQAHSMIPRGQQLALIRWGDDTEALVVFPTANTVPSPGLLTAAYWNGSAARYASGYLDELWAQS